MTIFASVVISYSTDFLCIWSNKSDAIYAALGLQYHEESLSNLVKLDQIEFSFL